MKGLWVLVFLVIGLNSYAIENGRYELSNYENGFVVIDNEYLVREAANQVGGPGGISNSELVPFPTVCRTKTIGKIVYRDELELQYEVMFITLVDSKENTPHCDDYIEKYRDILNSSWVSFSLQTNELNKITE